MNLKLGASQSVLSAPLLKLVPAFPFMDQCLGTCTEQLWVYCFYSFFSQSAPLWGKRVAWGTMKRYPGLCAAAVLCFSSRLLVSLISLACLYCGKLLHGQGHTLTYLLVESTLHVSLHSLSEQGVHLQEKSARLLGLLFYMILCVSPVQRAVCGSSSQEITFICLWGYT